jgi:hypothetical protein
MEQVRARIENSPSMQDTVRGTKQLARSSTPAVKKSHSATPIVTLKEDWLYSRKIGELNYAMLRAALSTAQGTYPLWQL